MTIQAFQKALCRLPLEQEERDSLTADELFLLVLARRLNRLTWAEQRRMDSGGRQRAVRSWSARRYFRPWVHVSLAGDIGAFGRRRDVLAWQPPANVPSPRNTVGLWS